MCKSLFTCVLIAVLVLEAAAEPQNDDVFERKIEDYDIPEFELLEWPDSRSLLNRTLKQNTNFRSISKENPRVVINDTRQKSSKKTSQEIDTTDSSYRITVPYVVPNTQINIPESVGIRPVNSVDPALYSNKPTDNTNIEPITIVHKPDTISGASDGVPASTKPPVSNIKPLASVKPVTSGHVPTSSSNKPSASTSSGIRIKPAVNSAKPSVSKPVAGVKPALTTAKPVATTTKSKKKKGNKQQQTSPSSGGLAPCKCLYGVCTCCTGPLLDLFQQKFCMKVVYTPEDFAFDYALMLNNRVMYQDKLSGKNPRPACISLPRFSSLRLCARFSNIYFAGRNVHMCLGLEGQWNSLELFSTNFDCLRLGAQGLAVVKPEDGGGIPPGGVVAGYDSIIEAGDDIEDYDENVVRALFGSFY